MRASLAVTALYSFQSVHMRLSAGLHGDPEPIISLKNSRSVTAQSPTAGDSQNQGSHLCPGARAPTPSFLGVSVGFTALTGEGADSVPALLSTAQEQAVHGSGSPQRRPQAQQAETFTPSPRVGFKHVHLIPEPKFLSLYVLTHQVCGLKRRKKRKGCRQRHLSKWNFIRINTLKA